jgi:hypothetical protein
MTPVPFAAPKLSRGEWSRRGDSSRLDEQTQQPPLRHATSVAKATRPASRLRKTLIANLASRAVWSCYAAAGRPVRFRPKKIMAVIIGVRGELDKVDLPARYAATPLPRGRPIKRSRSRWLVDPDKSLEQLLDKHRGLAILGYAWTLIVFPAMAADLFIAKIAFRYSPL